LSVGGGGFEGGVEGVNRGGYAWPKPRPRKGFFPGGARGNVGGAPWGEAGGGGFVSKGGGGTFLWKRVCLGGGVNFSEGAGEPGG